jgi:hypothetical protein
MDNACRHDVRDISRNFQILGEFRSAMPWGSGHINDSYCALYSQAGVEVRYLVQRVNHTIFKNPVGLMQNVERVTAHLATKWADQPDASRRVLTLVPTRNGRCSFIDASGDHWRVYLFIEKARTYDVVESPGQAFQAGRAFGEFQALLADLPAPRLIDTIPDFHNTPKRFASFEIALAADVAGRARLAGPEIDFALSQKSLCKVLLEANLPARTTHNDTKFNNVLLDDQTGEGICVIDLDTVMPGLAPYDFGDLVRTTTSRASEDERDLSKVFFDFPLFESIARGYLSAAGGFITKAERQHLAVSGLLITFETGLRFLTDFLAGDAYFKVHRQGQNLDRCRTQFKLMGSMARQENSMRKLVEEIQ